MRCRFWKDCEYFDEDEEFCSLDSGKYYDEDRFAGCRRKFEESEKN
jgi:hypothetical protein